MKCSIRLSLFKRNSMSRYKIKESQPIKPSQILSEVLNSLFLYLEMSVTLIFDSLSGFTAICFCLFVFVFVFVFSCIQEFEEKNVVGRKCFIIFLIFLILEIQSRFFGVSELSSPKTFQILEKKILLYILII